MSVAARGGSSLRLAQVVRRNTRTLAGPLSFASSFTLISLHLSAEGYEISRTLVRDNAAPAS